MASPAHRNSVAVDVFLETVPVRFEVRVRGSARPYVVVDISEVGLHLFVYDQQTVTDLIAALTKARDGLAERQTPKVALGRAAAGLPES